LRLASTQLTWIDDAELHQFLRGELLRVAEALARKENRRNILPEGEANSFRSPEEIGPWLLEVAHDLASAENDAELAASAFAQIVLELVNTLPSLAPTAWIVTQLVYERTPARMAKHLHRVLVLLRAVNKRGFSVL